MKTIKFIALLIVLATTSLYLCFNVLNQEAKKTENLQQNIVSDNISEETEQQKIEDVFCAVSAVKSPNNELQIYDPQQVQIENNLIRLTAIEDDGQYISGKAESTMCFRYGTFTFQVNTIKGNGLFPAIWMLPTDGNAYPEIDIYELVGNEPKAFFGVLHYLKDGTKNSPFFKHKFSSDNIPETYVLRFEWTPEKMVWYLNDEELYSIQENIPDQHMYMIINLAVGGDWPGDPDENTKFPSEFHVEILDFNPQNIYYR